jgi:hypothetical protein
MYIHHMDESGKRASATRKNAPNSLRTSIFAWVSQPVSAMRGDGGRRGSDDAGKAEAAIEPIPARHRAMHRPHRPRLDPTRRFRFGA